MEDYKLPLLGLFTAEQLDTIHPSPFNTCPFCGETCGALFELVGCACSPQLSLCGDCMDDCYDSCVENKYLFSCPHCEQKVVDYTIYGSKPHGYKIMH